MLTRRGFLKLVIGPLAAGFPRVAGASNDGRRSWSCFGYDRGNTSHKSVSAPVNSPTLSWNFKTVDEVRASPTVENETVYVGCMERYVSEVSAVGPDGRRVETARRAEMEKGRMYALNSEDGSLVWEFRTDGEEELNEVEDWQGFMETGVESTACVSDGRVYFGSWNGCVYAVDAENGEELWRFVTPIIVRGSPVEVDGTVYIGGWGGNMYALDAVSGEELWTYDTDNDHVYATPSVVDGSVYLTSGNTRTGGDRGRGGGVGGGIHAVDAETGERIWRHRTWSFIGSSPAVVDGKVYVGGAGFLRALDAETGEVLWRTLGLHHSASPAVDDERVYVGGIDHVMRAYDRDTGELVWTYLAGGRFYSNDVTVTDEAVYVGCLDGMLYAFDKETGDRLWSFAAADRQDVRGMPTVVDGVVYFGSSDGTVYAVEEGANAKDEGFSPPAPIETRRERRRERLHLLFGRLPHVLR